MHYGGRIGNRSVQPEIETGLSFYVALAQSQRRTIAVDTTIQIDLSEIIESSGAVSHMRKHVKMFCMLADAYIYGIENHRACLETQNL